ncbi:MAG: DUF1156 domain-containing protein [Gammaproteobacteria bacterium]|nr:DUF1156 domain-containing protein [Gammaproteobacteria bacterium]
MKKRSGGDSASDRRLIEEWLPIAELSEESTRERRAMTALPPTYYLHVWWARRPLVASRAAVLGSLLPEGADREKFLHVLGIHGDPVGARRAIDGAKQSGRRIENPYDYDRAFKYCPTPADRRWLEQDGVRNWQSIRVLDPTAGGGSIPFETQRSGLVTLGNDLNPVAALVAEATVTWPTQFPSELADEFEALASAWRQRIQKPLEDMFPQTGLPDIVDVTYVHAHSVRCPYCAGLVPLSPNWRLASGGTGVRLRPDTARGHGSEDRVCTFQIVKKAREQSPGTVSRGTGTCPYPDCGQVIDGDEIKRQAQDGEMGSQLYAVIYKRRVKTRLKSGKRGKDRWVRGYRAPRPADDNSAEIQARLDEKLPEWEAFDIVPSERIPDGNKTTEAQRYGMTHWRDLFSPRQLLCHGTTVEIYREMLEEDRREGKLTPVRKAAYGYLALTLDTVLNYNSRGGRWDTTTSRVRSFFDRHDFAFVWSFGEMAPLIVSVGYDWAIVKTAKAIRELVELVAPETTTHGGRDLFSDNGDPQKADTTPNASPPVTITCKSADNLDHLEDASIDAIVMDPPWEANVMYAELSDFFYVWLKRTAGHVFPELFRSQLTDKDNEAVANVARFKGQKGAGARATRDYQERMAAIFAECRRVLKPNGIMTLMFTHKAAGAWDALTTGLMKAGFMITASWPINTEAPGSMHIKDKAAANSTIFLVCRPRERHEPDTERETRWWEDAEPLVAKAVRKRVKEFQRAGIGGVDLYLASFGPALEEFSRHWPLERRSPRPKPKQRKRQFDIFEEEWDPYATTPEDALDVARREVKRWRLDQLAHMRSDDDLDPVTAFFVLAWDAFKAPKFAYDEGLKLARAVGVNLETDVVRRLGAKSGQNLVLWDAPHRAAKGALGPADGSRGMIDVLHHAAFLARDRSLDAALDMLRDQGVEKSPDFATALEAVLEVLPVSRNFRGFDLGSKAAALESASEDFDALERLRRLAFSEVVGEPEQLKLWREETA